MDGRLESRVSEAQLSVAWMKLTPNIVPTTLVKSIIDSVAKTTAQDEPKITEYDTLAGDGDCGETLLNGVNGRVPSNHQCFIS